MFTNGTRKVMRGLDRGSGWQEEKQEKQESKARVHTVCNNVGARGQCAVVLKTKTKTFLLLILKTFYIEANFVLFVNYFI